MRKDIDCGDISSAAFEMQFSCLFYSFWVRVRDVSVPQNRFRIKVRWSELRAVAYKPQQALMKSHRKYTQIDVRRASVIAYFSFSEIDTFFSLLFSPPVQWYKCFQNCDESVKWERVGTFWYNNLCCIWDGYWGSAMKAKSLLAVGSGTWRSLRMYNSAFLATLCAALPL